MIVRVITSALLAGLTYRTAAQAPITPDERALYGVINRSSGRCLDVARSATTGGAPLVQWEFTHALSQQWQLVPLREGADFYRLQVRHSSLCLTLVANPELGSDQPTPLVQRAFTGGPGQQWRLVPAGPTGSFMLENRLDGRVATLAAPDKFNGTAVVASRAVGRASQQWRLFQLQLRVATGPPYFGPPQALPALASTGGGYELQPVPLPDNRHLYFSRTRWAENVEGVAESGDVWLSERADPAQPWGTPRHLPAVPTGPNSPQNNAAQAAVGHAGRPALVLRGTYAAGGFLDEGLSRLDLSAGDKARPVPLRIANYYSTSPATGFYLTPDEKILLLSLERDDSQGANDLYLSRADGAGGYSAPQSLGAVINSPGYDFAPWLSADTKTLYFSSYGHQGYGSADIFVSQRLDDTWERWSPPQNLGPRFNGPGYDAFFALGPDGTAYFSSSGKSDTAPRKLFQTTPGPAPVVDSAAVAAQAAIAADPQAQPRAMLTGRVLDARTGQPLPGATVVAQLLSQTVNFRATAQPDALGFQLSLVPGRYLLTTTLGLLGRTDTLTFDPGQSRRYEPRLTPAAVGTRLELPDLLFVQSQAKILGPSYTTLNRLAASLKENPTLEIRLEGHTDNQGAAAANQQLSEARVAEVKRYLVSRGVAEGRISTVGYGGSRPKFSNDREETRRLNRRVELVITK